MARSRPKPNAAATRPLRLIHGIVGAAAVLVIVSVLGSVALMAVAARTVDRVESQDEIALVRRTISRTLDRTERELTSATVWDAAYKAMGARIDAAWADTDFATYYKDQFGHDLTFVMRLGEVVYASKDGVQTPVKALGGFPARAEPIAAAIAAEARHRRHAGKLSTAAEVTRTGLMRVDGATYLVAFAAVTPESRAVADAYDGPEAVVVTARRMDAGFVKNFAQDLGLRGLQLLDHPSDRHPRVELADIDGRPVGAMAWDAANPGVSLLKSLAPWLAAGLIVLALAGIILLQRVSEALAQLKASRLALVAAKDEAEAANAAKTLFLANMSHEIRTPLNGVLGMAQVMASDTLSEPQARRLRILEESGRALLALLNDILDIARLESHAVRLRAETFDVGELVEAACAAFSGAAAAKGLKLALDVAPDARGGWRGDPLRLRQVLGNLIANAVKFTERGAVTVRVRPSGKGLRFEVEDTGPGIAAEHLPQLFKSFSQVDGSLTRAHEGAGLGLSICRELVELMGGVIGAHSTPGHGSSFHFVVPLTRATGERPSLRVVAS